MTDFFILALAVFLAVVVVRMLTLNWGNADQIAKNAEFDREDPA
ncbi:MAG: hypothetical protein AAFY65_09495 [Pseudomonadota bacterium]